MQGVQKALGVDTKIKWLNDAVLNGKALWDPDRDECTDRLHQYVVIGTGINVNQMEFPKNRGDCDSTGDRNGSFRQPGSGRKAVPEAFEEDYEKFLKQGDLSPG